MHTAATVEPCVLNPRALEVVSGWAEQYRPIWEARFDQMASYLERLAEDSTPKDSTHD